MIVVDMVADLVVGVVMLFAAFGVSWVIGAVVGSWSPSLGHSIGFDVWGKAFLGVASLCMLLCVAVVAAGIGRWVRS